MGLGWVITLCVMLRVVGIVALGVVVLACAGLTGPTHLEAMRDLREGRLEEAIEKLEWLRDRRPEDIDIRLDLQSAYSDAARRAQVERRADGYAEYLAKAQAEALAILELDPEHPGPHMALGVLAAYRGDLEGAAVSFRNAWRLAPWDPAAHLNLAEVYVYLGRLVQARYHLDSARRARAHPVQAEMVELLAAWRLGDYVEARDIFDVAYGLNPDYVRGWNAGAEPIESFEDLTAACCEQIYCGPNMQSECREMAREPVARSVTDELRREELRLEMERRRRLEEIYARRRDLDIIVEPEPDEAPAPPESEAPPANAEQSEQSGDGVE